MTAEPSGARRVRSPRPSRRFFLASSAAADDGTASARMNTAITNTASPPVVDAGHAPGLSSTGRTT